MQHKTQRIAAMAWSLMLPHQLFAVLLSFLRSCYTFCSLRLKLKRFSSRKTRMSSKEETPEQDKNGSLATPLARNRNEGSWINAEDETHHVNMAKYKQQIDENLFETSNIKNLNTLTVPSTTDFMPDELLAPLFASSHQEPPSGSRATSAINGQNPPVRPPTEPWSRQLGLIGDQFTISTSHVGRRGRSQDPRTSCYQTSQRVPETFLKQLDGPHIQSIPTADNQSQQTAEPEQPVRAEFKAHNIAPYFPPFRGGHDAVSAPPVMSTTAVHNFTHMTPDSILQTPDLSSISSVETGRDRSLLLGEYGESAVRISNYTEGSGSEAQVLAIYNLEGFQYAKLWLHNPEECRYCDEEFANVKSVQEHMKRKHRDTVDNTREPTEKVKCEECDALLMNEANLRRHVENVHGDGKAEIICEMCSALFSSSFSASTHMRDVHGIQPASRHRSNGLGRKKKKIFFRCETCGYCSKEKSNVIRHVRSAHVRKKCSGHGRVVY